MERTLDEQIQDVQRRLGSAAAAQSYPLNVNVPQLSLNASNLVESLAYDRQQWINRALIAEQQLQLVTAELSAARTSLQSALTELEKYKSRNALPQPPSEDPKVKEIVRRIEDAIKRRVGNSDPGSEPYDVVKALESIESNVKGAIANSHKDNKQLQERLQKLSNLEKEVSDLRASTDASKVAVIRKAREMDAIDGKLEEINEKLEAGHKKYASVLDAISGLHTNLKNTEAAKKRLALDVEAKTQELEVKAAELESLKEAHAQETSGLQADIRDRNNTISKKTKDVTTRNSIILAKNLEIERIGGLLDNAEKEMEKMVSNLEDSVTSIKNLEDKMKTMREDLVGLTKEKEAWVSEKAALESTAKNLTTERDKLVSEKKFLGDSLKSAETDLEVKEALLSDRSGEIEDLRARLAETTEELSLEQTSSRSVIAGLRAMLLLRGKVAQEKISLLELQKSELSTAVRKEKEQYLLLENTMEDIKKSHGEAVEKLRKEIENQDAAFQKELERRLQEEQARFEEAKREYERQKKKCDERINELIDSVTNVEGSLAALQIELNRSKEKSAALENKLGRATGEKEVAHLAIQALQEEVKDKTEEIEQKSEEVKKLKEYSKRLSSNRESERDLLISSLKNAGANLADNKSLLSILNSYIAKCSKERQDLSQLALEHDNLVSELNDLAKTTEELREELVLEASAKKELDALLTEKSDALSALEQERVKLLEREEKLLQKVRELQASLGSANAKINEQLKEIELEKNRHLKNIQNKNAEHKKEIQRKVTEIEAAKTNVVTLKANVERKKKEIEEHEKAIADHLKNVAERNETIKARALEIAGLKEAADNQKKVIREAESRIAALGVCIDQKNKNLASAAQTLAARNKNVDDMSVVIKSHETEIRELKMNVAGQREIVKNAEEKVKALTANIEKRTQNMEALQKTSNELRGSINSKNATIAAHEEEIEKSKAAIRENLKKIAASEDRIVQLENFIRDEVTGTVNDYSKMLDDQADAIKRLQTISQELGVLREKKSELSAERATMEAYLERFRSIYVPNIAKQEAEIMGALEQEKGQRTRVLQDMKNDLRAKIDATESKIREVNEAITQVDNEIDVLNNERLENDAILERIELEIRRNPEDKKQLVIAMKKAELDLRGALTSLDLLKKNFENSSSEGERLKEELKRVQEAHSRNVEKLRMQMENASSKSSSEVERLQQLRRQEVSDFEARKNALESEIAQLKRQSNSNRADLEKRVADAESKIASLAEQGKQNSNRGVKNGEAIRELTRYKEDLEAKLRGMQDLENKIRNLKKARDEVNTKHLEDLKKTKRNPLTPSLIAKTLDEQIDKLERRLQETEHQSPSEYITNISRMESKSIYSGLQSTQETIQMVLQNVQEFWIDASKSNDDDINSIKMARNKALLEAQTWKSHASRLLNMLKAASEGQPLSQETLQNVASFQAKPVDAVPQMSEPQNPVPQTQIAVPTTTCVDLHSAPLALDVGDFEVAAANVAVGIGQSAIFWQEKDSDVTAALDVAAEAVNEAIQGSMMRVIVASPSGDKIESDVIKRMKQKGEGATTKEIVAGLQECNNVRFLGFETLRSLLKNRKGDPIANTFFIMIGEPPADLASLVSRCADRATSKLVWSLPRKSKAVREALEAGKSFNELF